MKDKIRSASAGKPAATIRSYLAGQPKDVRAALESLVETIRGVVPDAVEGTSYGLPALFHGGKPLAAFAALKGHMSYYPMSGGIVGKYKTELRAFVTSKGAVQFTVEKPIPPALLKKLVKARVKEIEGEA